MTDKPIPKPESSGESDDTVQTNLTVRRDIWAVIGMIAADERCSKSAVVEAALLNDARVAYELDLRAKRPVMNISNEGADRG